MRDILKGDRNMNKIAIGATAIGATAIIGLTTGLIISIIKNKQKNKIINNLKDQVLDCKCEIIAIKETERQCKMLDKMNDSKKLFKGTDGYYHDECNPNQRWKRVK